MTNMDTYKTSDKYFAAYLMARGKFCIKAVPAENPTMPDQKEFIFVDVENPKEYEDTYFRGVKENMSAYNYARKLMTTTKILKDAYGAADVERIKRG